MPTITFVLDAAAAAAYARGDTTVWTQLNQRIACWARGACCGNVHFQTSGVTPAVVVNTALCAGQGALTLKDGGTNHCTGITTDKVVTVGATDVAPLDPNTCEAVQLSQPSGLATGTITATAIAVSWTAVPHAATYTVEYRAGTSGSWTAFGTTPTSPTVNITGLTASTAYQIRVTAKAPNYTDSDPSLPISASTIAA